MSCISQYFHKKHILLIYNITIRLMPSITEGRYNNFISKMGTILKQNYAIGLFRGVKMVYI